MSLTPIRVPDVILDELASEQLIDWPVCSLVPPSARTLIVIYKRRLWSHYKPSRFHWTRERVTCRVAHAD